MNDDILKKMEGEDNKFETGIWFDRVAFKQAVCSLERTGNQLCHARDDTYHRARAEAKTEVLFELLIKMHRETLDIIGDR